MKPILFVFALVWLTGCVSGTPVNPGCRREIPRLTATPFTDCAWEWAAKPTLLICINSSLKPSVFTMHDGRLT